jgi:glycosyltransferase involved in cell wall biosynthesis
MRYQVSILLPIRNEEKYIKKCIESILDQDYFGDFLEILILDGMSDDSTREILAPYLNKYKNIFLIDNAKKIVSAGLNIGIKIAKGDIVIRMDGHATYSKNYISKCVEFLTKTNANNVGGILEHKGRGFLGSSIALSQTSFFGLGGAKFRTATKSQFVDTVFLGAWFKETFEKYGYFNEKLARNQDIEHNSRIRAMGGKIFLTPEIVATYYVRDNLWDLFKQNFKNGFWNIKTLKINSQTLAIRHFVPLIFVLSLMITYFLMPVLWFFVILSYISCSLFFAFKIAVEYGFRYFFIMPIIFFVLHMSYGLGMLIGIFAELKNLKSFKK